VFLGVVVPLAGRWIVGFRRLCRLGVLALIVSLTISCNEEDVVGPLTGSLAVTTTTSGTNTDGDGYTVQIDSEQPAAIGSSGTVEFSDLTVGDHTLLLAGLASNCTVTGENPRTVIIIADETTPASFEVTCSAVTGTLEIGVVSGGESPDPNGFTLSVDGRQSFPHIPPGKISLEISAGAHTVEISDVAPNCTASEGSSQAVTVSPNNPVSIGFTITCAFIGATIWTSISLPPNVTGRALWGTSPTDLFVVGSATQPDRSGIWHYDGQTWTEQVSRADTNFVSVWGNTSNQIFAIGSGAILQSDGADWSDVPGPVFNPPVSSFRYNDVWGVGHDLFVAGSLDRGTPATSLLVHFDGAEWSEMPVPNLWDHPRFTGLAGTSPSDVWAIGWAFKCEDCNNVTSMVLHYDGSTWSESLTSGFDEYNGIYAFAPNDVWIAASNEEFALLFHFDGISWSRQELWELSSTPNNPVRDVWGSSSSDVYVVGQSALLRYDGTSWRTIEGVTGQSVWGTSSRDVYVLNWNQILHGTP
jgi:hypothetical protein